MLFQRSILCLAICAAFPLHASETEKKAVDTSSETESAIEFNDQFVMLMATQFCQVLTV